MTGKPRQLNNAPGPRYAEPVLGNPVSTLMESGVGNCFPGLEFDLRQLDARFFPGLVFEFPGITPSGPDGTQGARLLYADPDGDPTLSNATIDSEPWLYALKSQFAGPAAAALGDGTWWLHWVEQDGQRIEMYDYALYQNAAVLTPYEGETCWWIIRLIERDKPLKIALTQRDDIGNPTGIPVELTGRRRRFLDDNGMIDEIYDPGELTSSMCSPWTHDFRDCACHYWASNHPDVALGPVHDPQEGLGNRTDSDDPAQAVTFVDWMRRRSLPLRDISAQTTIEKARPDRYDPYEINLHWEELDFVIQGQEMNETPGSLLAPVTKPYKSVKAMVEDLSNNLAGMELTLALEYLYAYFSLRAPDEVTEKQEAAWPGLTEDLRAARQLLLSVALSEMTHLRWVNQALWLVCDADPDVGPYTPVLKPSETIMEPDPDDPAKEVPRKRALRRAEPAVLESFVEVERPGADLDTEYIRLVAYMRENAAELPNGLYELAVRIDSDGLQHYQKFRDILRILNPYTEAPELYLRDVEPAEPPYAKKYPDDADDIEKALDQIRIAVAALREAYPLEAARRDMPAANALIHRARDAMHELDVLADKLARRNIGVPFFVPFEEAET